MVDASGATGGPPMRLEAVLECRDLDAAAASLVELGCRLDTISPADAPSEMVFRAGEGAIRLVRSETPRSGRVTLRADHLKPGTLRLEDSVVEIRPLTPAMVVPDAVPRLTVSRIESGADGVGRAGMHYRDLLADRWGGRFVASHITIPDGGDVPDYVHFHRIRFQMIFVANGWVEVVYEDQGEPFRMEVGDCVLQPPEIRHRVLRSSPGLEVVEVGCPAVHDTVVDHRLGLPTPTVRRDRDFGGQRFVRHVAADAALDRDSRPGWVVRDTGIGSATGGLAGARVVTAVGGLAGQRWTHDGEYLQIVILSGRAVLRIDSGDGGAHELLGPRDAVAVPPGCRWEWQPDDDSDAPFSVLEVALPDDAVRRNS